MQKILFPSFLIKRYLHKFQMLKIPVYDAFSDLKQVISLSMQRDQLWFLLKRVKPIEGLLPNESTIEVVSFISHYDLPLYLTAIKTFCYFSEKKYLITVFDDGTLTDDDVRLLKAFIKNVRYVSISDADRSLQKYLRGKKYTKEYVKKAIMARRTLQTLCLSIKETIFMFDSDLVFFKKPKELVKWFESDKNPVIFMSDGANMYNISTVEAKYCFNLELVSRLNSGLIGFNKKLVTLDFIEKYFKWLSILDPYGHRLWLIDQTILGLLFSQKKVQPTTRLSQKYLISGPDHKAENLICRHYVKPVRKMFYPAAIATLQQIVQEESVSNKA